MTYELVTRRASDVRGEAVSWLWPGRIARGKVTLLAGDPGLGKSFITCDIAARVTRDGSPAGEWPDGPSVMDAPGDVLILNAEDDAGDTLRPRLEAAGADLERVQFVDGVDLPESRAPSFVELDRHVSAIKATLRKCRNPALVIIDPISAYMGGADANSNAQVRAVLAELTRAAQCTGAAVLAVTHLNKSQLNASKVVYRTMGSLAFTAAARMVWYVCPLNKDPQVRAMTLVKSNLRTDVKGASFRIDDGRIEWLDMHLPLTADQTEQGLGEESEDHAPATRDAITFLNDLLNLQEGPRQSVVAGKAGRLGLEAGVSASSLTRARKIMGLSLTKTSAGWVWGREVRNT